MSYRFDGKQKLLSLGVYPAVSLAKARQRRDKARELLADGIDPSVAKKAGRLADAIVAANTFELVAREFHKSKCDSWSPSYAAKWLRGMEKDLFPYLGSLPCPLVEQLSLTSVQNDATYSLDHFAPPFSILLKQYPEFFWGTSCQGVTQ